TIEILQSHIERRDRDALVLAVRADVVDIHSQPACAIGWNTRVAQEAAVSGARAHGGDDRDARPELRGDLADGLEDSRSKGRRFAVDVDHCRSHSDLIVADDAHQRALNILEHLAGQNTAIYRGPGRLRQGIIGMPGLKQGSDASGAELRIVWRQRGQPGYGL